MNEGAGSWPVQRRLISPGLAAVLAVGISAWLWVALLRAAHVLPKR